MTEHGAVKTMTLAEMIASIAIVFVFARYVFARLILPVMEWHEKDKRHEP